MSVNVHQLTKRYGAQKAVDTISFRAEKGQILGFLGPNGAGKTTTMKIITCYIPQSGGKVEVCGFDTELAPVEVRRRIGYLPENNPLYTDMYVREYLQFVARLHGVRRSRQRIEEMIELTGLEKERRKRIGALSKGYRQRVGLAQAMLHDPEVLILDEPTSGLDPNQLLEIRRLIKQLGREKTVIFSTHIMQEVQALCDRVLIINRGQLVADDPIDQLQQRLGAAAVVRAVFRESVPAEKLKSIPGVSRIQALPGGGWQLTAAPDTDIRPDIFHFAVAEGLTLLELQEEKRSVEDVFQELTRSARETAGA